MRAWYLGNGYQSWSYYDEDFGIYDDDPEIVTLDYAEFQQRKTIQLKKNIKTDF